MFEIIEDLGKKVADYLPHTPVSAFGVNFLYETKLTDARPVSKIQEVILEHVGKPKECLQRYSVPGKDHTVNVTVKEVAGEGLAWDFNFDHRIDSLSHFKGRITESSILDYKAKAERILASLLEGVSTEQED